MTEVRDVIDFILGELRRQGVVVADAVGTAAMAAVHEAYGGERVYVAKLPKLQTSVRIAQAQGEGARTNVEIVKATGISLRQVERLRRRRR